MPNATNTKPLVTLPKDVAQAIEELRKYGGTNEELLRHAFGVEDEYNETIYVFTFEKFDTFLSALVNGYQVEKSPEELVREFYESFVESDYNDFERGIAYGIKQTVKMLGITITGINAPTEGGEA